MKNKSLLFLVFSILLVLVSCKQTGGSVTVFKDGVTDYSIITAEGAGKDAQALTKGLWELSGSSLNMYTDASPESTHEILIGDTNRAETTVLVKKLQAVATLSAFHYIVAENGGKIVILSDSDIGYIYALDYIKSTYITDGTLSIPTDTYDLKQVVWDDYYASELYFERLTAEVDKNRYEEGKNQFENEMNRYDEITGNTIMTLEQAIEKYKKQAAAFNTADFGEYSASTFTSANKYGKPGFYPGDTHPRVLFTENSIDSLRENINSSQNSAALKMYMTLSDVPCDGKFKTVTGNMVENYDADLVAKIEAKAFRYAMTGEEIYGYEAIVAVKNAMLTINVPHSVGDWCRSYGHLMYVMACVYDWCYELLTDTDKTQLVAGGVNLLGAHFELVCNVMSIPNNRVPVGQGAIYGHGAEDQLLVDYLSFAIACYNEAPEIYELVAGRILNDFTEAQNYMFESGTHWESAMYGPYRSCATILANTMFNKMTDGREDPFSDKIEDAATTFTYFVRPDEQVFRIGDMNENRSSYNFQWMAVAVFYAANYYENSYLKSFAYKHLDSFTYFTHGVASLSSVQFLATNDPGVSHICEGTAPLTCTASYPNTGIFAKSANNNKNAFAIYMTMPENYALSHAHMECGSFQIYYKGALASDSGAYSGWSDTHHMGYNMQTISSNSLLIYNPSLANTKNPTYPNLIYSGGQSISKTANLPGTLDELLKHERLNQCTILGVANVEKDGEYLYSYMGGDMTAAYDSETVSEVTRYMFAVATGNKECPYAFLTFDRITSLDASYHKSALIHVQQAPEILGDYYTLSDTTNGKLIYVDSEASDNYAIITNGEGKLVVQSVGYDTEYTVIGGEDHEFWIPGVDENKNYSLEAGKNLPTNRVLVEDSIAEYGWGRIEISPTAAEKTSHMLTVMYVTDAKNNDAPTKAEEIASANLSGSLIFGKAVLFSKNEKLLSTESSFELSSDADCYIAGVKEGSWQITHADGTTETVTVEKGANLITFKADKAGTYTIKPAN